MADLYSEDLAFIHHTAFGDFALRAAPRLLELLQQAGISNGLVVDLGCGSGIGARELIRAGYEVVGVDQSASMLELARQTAPDATFLRGSLHEIAIPPCRAVTVIGEGLSYDDGTHAGLEPVFRRVADALEPGGLFVFDVIVRSRDEGMHYDRLWEGPDWTLRVAVRETPADRLLIRTVELSRSADGERRVSRETHRVLTFDTDEIEAGLHAAGFSVCVSRCYGSCPLPSQRLAFQARKRC